jgi:Ca2+-binding RTX toxin-like protein
MRSLVPLLTSASIAVAVALASTTSTATAAAGTCQGVPATLIGTPGQALTGTDGPDVVLTDGASLVKTLGGTDLICVTGGPSQVYAGEGDDVVDASTSTRFGAQVRLGPGSDTFTGSTGFDVVYAGDEGNPGSAPAADAERDVIHTGAAGPVRDTVTSGQPGTPNDDYVRMGSGQLIWAGIPTAATDIRGGGSSSLNLEPAATESVTLDSGDGTLAVGAQPVLQFGGFAEYRVYAPTGLRSFAFRGSSAEETLNLHLGADTPHRVTMGAGADHLRFIRTDGLPAGGTYDGGSGRDRLTLALPDERDLDLDLRRGRLSLGQRSAEVTVRARRFEDALVMARDVELVGTAARNDLVVGACRSRMEGRGGRDVLSTFEQFDEDAELECKPHARLLGGSGNDRLTGTRGPDVLLGGPGRDRADGDKGRDVCQAEVRKRCEVRR